MSDPKKKKPAKDEDKTAKKLKPAKPKPASDAAQEPTAPPDPRTAASPNHAVNQPKKRTISPDRARDRLIKRYGYKEDELKVSFKTDEELVAFYLQVASAKVDAKTEAEIGWDSDDSFDAPKEEKDRYAAGRLAKQKARFAEATSKKPVNPAEPLAEPVPGAEEPPPVKGLEEFLAVSNELDDLIAEGEQLLEADEKDKKKKQN